MKRASSKMKKRTAPPRRSRVAVVSLPRLESFFCVFLVWCSLGTLRGSTPADVPFPLLERFESFGMKDGFPTHKVHCVLPASDGKLWVGTWKGLVVREQGKFRNLGIEDGLSHPMIVCLAEDPRSGDLWIGTMRGLNRYS